MKTFKDGKGRTWQLVLNAWQMKLVRDALKIDLHRLYEDNQKLMNEVASDPLRLVEIFWVLCSKQAKDDEVTEEEFWQGMDGDAIRQATDAFVEESTDFFHQPKTRALLRRMRTKEKELRDETAQQGMKQLESLDVQKEIERLMAQQPRLLNGSSGDAQASAESTPAPSPSAN